MKLIILIIVFAAGGWYWFVGGRQLTEADVRKFYEKSQKAMDEGNAAALCALHAEKFTGHSVQIFGQERAEKTTDRAESCASGEKLFSRIDELSEKLGKKVNFDLSTDIDSIVISADKKP